MKLKIALIQQKSSRDISENRRKGLEAVKVAAENGAKIIGFSELTFEPFYPQIPATEKIRQMGESIPGPTTELFSKLAADLAWLSYSIYSSETVTGLMILHP